MTRRSDDHESLGAARRLVGALAAALTTSARDALRYRADLLTSGLFLVTILFVFWRLWITVAESGGLVALSVSQLVAYLLVTELVEVSPGPVHVRLAEDIRSGAVAVQLLRPVPHVAWELARAIGRTAVRAGVLLGVGCAFVATFVGLPELSALGLLVGFGVLLPGALLLSACIRIMMGLLAFWVEDSAPFFWIWQKLAFVLGGLFLPLDLYPDWLRALCACLPFQVLLYAPARCVVAFDAHEAWRDVLRLLAWGVVFAAALVLMDAAGRRRLQLNGG